MNTTKIPVNQTLLWEWVKYQLRARGMSLASIARDLRIHRNAVTNVKAAPYPRVERAIAKTLGLLPAQIWPDRWNADNTPRRVRPGRAEHLADYQSNHTVKLGSRHPQIAAGV